MKLIKPLLFTLVSLALIIFILVYLILRASLPALDHKFSTEWVESETSIERDSIGVAKINAQSHSDAVFALGYAHGQDRLFQMDLLRRSAAGELSEIVGDIAIDIDKKARFHQFRQRAMKAVANLPEEQQSLLDSYAKGVNLAASEYTAKPFEYLLTRTHFKEWLPEDSLLVSYSMYLDLQGGQVERDLVNTFLVEKFGYGLLDFFNMHSPYQAALDGSILGGQKPEIPSLNIDLSKLKKSTNISDGLLSFDSIAEPLDIGSNNWAVTGALTDSASAMVSDDMHLGLRVPPIWYRAQLNYISKGKEITITGVSLPGTPIIIVGSNGHVSWGFTNANLDNVDWVRLKDETKTEIISEVITLKNGVEVLDIEMSKYGPVRTMNDKRYALVWVAHQDYAVNIAIMEMAEAENLEEAFAVADKVRIPVQNFMLGDAQGNAGWRPIGAVTARKVPSLLAIDEDDYSDLWLQQEPNLPTHINPSHGRLWTANARVISADDFLRYGNGGYAVGARGLQIRDRLFEKQSFTEQDFYSIQMDNEARFIMPWHMKLINLLRKDPLLYATDIEILNQWKNCACTDSIGYTLARRFRSTVINSLLAPIYDVMPDAERSLGSALRGIEPAIWMLLDTEAADWLPNEFSSYDRFLLASYTSTKTELIKQYDANPQTLEGLEWGNVNRLKIQHPFASQLGPFAGLLNMPEVDGFGDSFMPAVQLSKFGASQRLIVRPGNEDKGILTLPGGQSGHPLSQFYNAGFMAYAQAKNTPLLPSKTKHVITILPKMASNP
ncbi:MAG: penicillin amidase [Glaciecola sp.]|jgi:penicillin amidase